MSRAMMAFLLMPLFGFLMAIVLDFDFVGTKKVIFFCSCLFFYCRRMEGGWCQVVGCVCWWLVVRIL